MTKKSVARARAAALALSIASIATWVSSPATAVDVKGTVRAAPGTPKAPKPTRSAYWREWNGFLQPKDAKVDIARDVAVVLIGKHGSKDAVSVVMKGGDLFPRTIVAPVGAGIRIRNDDDFTHELYAEGLKEFEASETRAARGRQVTLGSTGNWPVRDAVASHVRGHLHVLDKLSAVAQPNTDGSFTFADVDAGKYVLKVFYGPDEISSKPIDVPSSGKALTVDSVLITPKS